MHRTSLVAMVTVFACLFSTINGRYKSRADTHPACYRNFHNVSYGETPCKNPLYTSCKWNSFSTDNDHICCSPDHYCCRNNQGCCRKTTNVYEVVGVVFGALAWVVILAVLSMCLGAHVKRLLSRKKKVYPIIEMKEKVSKSTI